MKIIFLECKGLGRPRKNLSIKEILRKFKLDICFKKLKNILSTIKVLGHSGGQKQRIQRLLTFSKIGGLQEGHFLVDSCIYGPTSNIGKEEFRIQLNDLGNLTEGAWCIEEMFTKFFIQKTKTGEEAPTPKEGNSTSGD